MTAILLYTAAALLLAAGNPIAALGVSIAATSLVVFASKGDQDEE